MTNLEQNQFYVYPNPTENEVFIVNESNGTYADLSYEVLDQLGRILTSGSLDPNVQVSTIDFSEFTNAIYYVNVKSAKNLLTNFKVIKL
jgi:hypothetical protein